MVTRNLVLGIGIVFSVLAITGTVILLPGIGKVYAASSSTKVPFLCGGSPTSCLFIPDPNVPGCENILLTGSLNIISTTADGKTILQFHPQGITGVGQTTHTTYRATGSTIYIAYHHNDDQTFTTVNNFNIIATSKDGVSSIEHFVLHTTVNAQGVITADITLADTEHNSCR
jgi:hypothetical protein